MGSVLGHAVVLFAGVLEFPELPIVLYSYSRGKQNSARCHKEIVEFLEFWSFGLGAQNSTAIEKV